MSHDHLAGVKKRRLLTDEENAIASQIMKVLEPLKFERGIVTLLSIVAGSITFNTNDEREESLLVTRHFSGLLDQIVKDGLAGNFTRCDAQDNKT